MFSLGATLPDAPSLIVSREDCNVFGFHDE